MASFIENVNKLANSYDIIASANTVFDEAVIPVLTDIAALDLEEAIQDLQKGNYLGNRKIDINLALNIVGITQELIDKQPDTAKAIWTNPAKVVLYDKAIATFMDSTVIELPFLFDQNPVTVSTHGDLLAQLRRTDYVYDTSQVDSIYQVTVGNNTAYTVTIDNESFIFTSGTSATQATIIAGIADMINASVIPITANVTDAGLKLSLTADVPGNPFYAVVSANLAINTITANRIEGPVETAFLAKLNNSLAANFAAPVTGEIVRLYDLIGGSSNLERLQLHAVSGTYIEENPLYYWAKTTSAFQTLSMRANDVIKIGTEIDNIILLATSIAQVIEIQNRLPQLVDTYDINGNLNGDLTIYNQLDELVELYNNLTEIVAVYNDVKTGGTKHIETNSVNMASIINTSNDLNLGVNSNIKRIGENILDIIAVVDNAANITAVNLNKANIDAVVSTVIPNMAEILLADNNAVIATTKAGEASASATVAAASAATAAAKSNEIKAVSVGSTITGAAGTGASVVYNPVDGKFTFVVPQGNKGDKGDSFEVNAVGLFTSRSLYDGQQNGFSFLAIDEGFIYFKMSNTSGDWSAAAPFGKGEPGTTGATGNGIASVSFHSTTHASSLAGQSGGNDTYRIAYTNATTYDFVIHNGLESVTTVAGRAGDIVLTKSDVGLANTDNTSDANKPVSTAQQTALDLKADLVVLTTALGLKANLASPTFTGTVGGITKTMVGLANVDNTTDAAKPISTATQTALDLKANLASPTFTGIVGGITKTMVGLANVDNTTDAAKPISTATQTALNLKAITNATDTVAGGVKVRLNGTVAYFTNNGNNA